MLCFSGVDGSGKSTLAAAVADELSARNILVRVAWVGYRPIVLRPIIGLARMILGGRTERFRAHYIRRKRGLLRRTVIGRLYLYAWLAEYLIGALIRVRLPVSRGEVVICDRYVPDLLVAASVDFGLDDSARMKLHDWLFRWLPRPGAVFWIDVPEEIAHGRKTDAPPLAHLRQQRAVYRRLAEIDGYREVNGLRDKEALLEDVLQPSLAVIGCMSSAKLH